MKQQNSTKALTSTKKKNGFIKEVIKNKSMFVMALPGIIYILAFCYLPMFGLVLAFKKVNYHQSIFLSPWNGLDNFKFMLKSPELIRAVINTFAYNIVFVFIGMIMTIGLAVGLDLLKNKFAKKFYQTVMIMPHFLSWVVVAYLAFAFLGVEYGIVNTGILPMFGIDPVNWYQTAKAWPIILIIVNFWKEWGYKSIIYTAAISGVDVQLYEAAEIDGANIWKQIINITIPSIKPMLVIMLIMSVGKILSTDIGLFYQVPMNQPALYETTNVISTYVYNLVTASGSLSLGMASAASFVQSIVSFILVVSANKVAKMIDSDTGVF